jgi:hypothetical protein
MNRDFRNALIRVARNKNVITYSEVGKITELNMENPAHRNELAEILGEISWHEHDNDNPLLSAVVVHAGDNKMPGKGFFDLAREAGRQRPGLDFGFTRQFYFPPVAIFVQVDRPWYIKKRFSFRHVHLLMTCVKTIVTIIQ